MNLLIPPLPRSVVDSVPLAMARLYRIIPVEIGARRLTVASGRPLSEDIRNELSTFLGGSVRAVTVARDHFDVAFEHYYPEPASDIESIRSAIAAAEELSSPREAMPPEKLLEITAWIRTKFSNQEVAREIQADPVFCSQMIDGDELWHYCSSEKSWDCLGGESGVALVQDGRAVDFKMSMLN